MSPVLLTHHEARYVGAFLRKGEFSSALDGEVRAYFALAFRALSLGDGDRAYELMRACDQLVAEALAAGRLPQETQTTYIAERQRLDQGLQSLTSASIQSRLVAEHFAFIEGVRRGY